MMKQLRRAAAAALLTLVIGACSDAAGPVGPSLEFASTDGAFRKPDDTTTVGANYVLRHASGAPALSAYTVSFWAVRGQDRSVTVRYGTDGPRYLRFTVPRFALDKGPDGRRLPTLSAISNITIGEDDPVQIINLTGISPGGGAPESSQTLNFITSNVEKPELFEELPTAEVVGIGPTGSLRFG